MKYTIHQVDAFTNEIFKGNPAGVMILDQNLSHQLMQNIASEMNLSETAFVDISQSPFDIRFFTPTNEIPLCGHATLASAYILYQKNIVSKNETINFKTLETNLTVSQQDDGIRMVFPKFKTKAITKVEHFFKLVGFEPSKFYLSENGWVIAIAKNESDIINASPKFSELDTHGLGHLIITSLTTNGSLDYVLRCFAPKSGINEDPVTGSVQCALAPLWNTLTGTTNFTVKQLSARTGVLNVNVLDNNVEIIGKAVTFFEADMNI